MGWVGWGGFTRAASCVASPCDASTLHRCVALVHPIDTRMVSVYSHKIMGVRSTHFSNTGEHREASEGSSVNGTNFNAVFVHDSKIQLTMNAADPDPLDQAD